MWHDCKKMSEREAKVLEVVLIIRCVHLVLKGLVKWRSREKRAAPLLVKDRIVFLHKKKDRSEEQGPNTNTHMSEYENVHMEEQLAKK